MIEIEVVRAGPGGRFARVRLRVAPGATVADALAASGLLEEGEAIGQCAMARFGERVGSEALLADGDRIDFCRPLIADPKEVRRQRARGAKRAPAR